MAKIPVGRDFSATATGRIEFTFRCQSCGYRSPVTIRATGSGSATAWLFINQDSARDRAAADAAADVSANAATILSMARCPACGVCDEARRRMQKLKGLLIALTTFAVSCLSAAWLSERWLLVVVMPIVGLVFGVQAYRLQASPANDVPGRLSFHEAPPPRPGDPGAQSLYRGPE